MTVTHRAFTIENKHGHLVRGDLHVAEGGGSHPTVVFCHGFKGFKDWGCFPSLADYLASEGLTVVRFNFSHNGVEEDFLNFSRLDLFEKNTFSLELDDLDAVLNWTVEQEEVDSDHMGLIGHSRGGATALIKAFADRDERVKAVVTWASVSSVNLYPPTVQEQWRKYGFVAVHNARTNQEMRMGSQFLEDLDANADRFDFKRHLKDRELPLLLLHGSKDTSVAPEQAEEILASANPDLTTHHVVTGADHTFGAKHPYTGPNPKLKEAFLETSSFLGKHLLGAAAE